MVYKLMSTTASLLYVLSLCRDELVGFLFSWYMDTNGMDLLATLSWKTQQKKLKSVCPSESNFSFNCVIWLNTTSSFPHTTSGAWKSSHCTSQAMLIGHHYCILPVASEAKSLKHRFQMGVLILNDSSLWVPLWRSCSSELHWLILSFEMAAMGPVNIFLLYWYRDSICGLLHYCSQFSQATFSSTHRSACLGNNADKTGLSIEFTVTCSQ